jgi:hypothetical protein
MHEHAFAKCKRFYIVDASIHPSPHTVSFFFKFSSPIPSAMVLTVEQFNYAIEKVETNFTLKRLFDLRTATKQELHYSVSSRQRNREDCEKECDI